MTIYGNECGGAGILLLRDGNVIVGEYPSPVDVLETYLGEPYVTQISMGPLGGRAAWQAQIRRGDGILINQYGTRDIQLSISLTPPTVESGKWSASWGSAGIWNGTSWVPGSGSSATFTIARYAYEITPI
jgi:hypothetical protein